MPAPETKGLEEAYRLCLAAARAHYENFPVASLLLPRRLRRHVAAVYAFARRADDIADEGDAPPERREAEMNALRDAFLASLSGRAEDPVLYALSATVKEFDLPRGLFLDLLDAFAQDIRVTEYQTFDQLLDYCRRSANPIGRILLLLFRCGDERTFVLSDALCTGLQLANFWQDVAVDLRKPRIYIPREEMERFGVSRADLETAPVPERVRLLVARMVERTRPFFEAARSLPAMVPLRLSLELNATWRGGVKILDAIARGGYDPVSRRPALRRRDKVFILHSSLFPLARRNATDPSATEREADLVTRNSRTNFYYSFSILPKHQRKAISILYAFCRITDDIVDEGEDREEKTATLKRWAHELELGLRNESRFPLLNQLNAIAQRFHIPVEHFFALIDGMQMDLDKQRYETFDELYEYCYKVASTVGLMCSEIFGYKNERTKQYAIKLGIALQLTNILRDVRHDAERGRIYLPLEDLRRFGYSEAQLLRRERTPAFERMMRFEYERARSYFIEARLCLAQEDRLSFFAARIMDRIYSRILDRIEQRNFDIFASKISISTASKLWIVLKEYSRNLGFAGAGSHG